MADIVISEFMEESAVAELSQSFDVLYDASLADRPDDLRRALDGARALIVRNRTEVRRPLLEAARRLECVGRQGVGLDNIDVAACRERGIAVYPAIGANVVSVAEYVIAAALMLLRRAYSASGEVTAGRWPRNALIGREIAGKRLGLVGFGAIGRATAERARALGMTVAAFDPYVAADDSVWREAERRELDALLADADVLSLHVPLTDATRNMIDSRAIARMKPGAVLINAARGGIVDESALRAALAAGRLAGAALDVFAEEPVTAATGKRFAGVPNLILTPHIAGLTEESHVRVSRLVAEKVRTHLKSRA